MTEQTKIQVLEETIGADNNAIIGTYVSRRDCNLTIKGEVVNAMQAYADQEKKKEAIAFMNWFYLTDILPEAPTAEGLFGLYLQSIT